MCRQGGGGLLRSVRAYKVIRGSGSRRSCLEDAIGANVAREGVEGDDAARSAAKWSICTGLSKYSPSYYVQASSTQTASCQATMYIHTSRGFNRPGLLIIARPDGDVGKELYGQRSADNNEARQQHQRQRQHQLQLRQLQPPYRLLVDVGSKQPTSGHKQH